MLASKPTEQGHTFTFRIEFAPGRDSYMHCYPFRASYCSAKFGTCTVVSVNETLVEAKMCTLTLESTHFILNKCHIYTHDGASAKFSTNLQETDYSVCN
jgi:hypothetical protein